MEQKVPSNFGILGKMVNFKRLTKIFEMNVLEQTVPFDSRPKNLEFLPQWIMPHVSIWKFPFVQKFQYHLEGYFVQCQTLCKSTITQMRTFLC